MLRDDARTVYVAMMEELGPEYLSFAIGVLRSALPARGYTGHVQGYTVHAVLQAVMKVLLLPVLLALLCMGRGRTEEVHAQ